jgi:hypothetical protein
MVILMPTTPDIGAERMILLYIDTVVYVFQSISRGMAHDFQELASRPATSTDSDEVLQRPVTTT